MKIGHPDNPIPQTLDLFKDSFFVSQNKTLDEYLKQGFNLIELHLQTFIELDKIKELQDYVKKVKDKNISLIMHCPIMEINKGKINALLPLKPESFTNSKQLDKKEFKKAIEVCSKLGIGFMTMHASTPLNYFNDEEFIALKQVILELSIFAKERNVVLCIETGGLTIPQLENFMSNNIKITLDTAHLIVDLMKEGYNKVEANQIVYDFFLRNKDNIPTIHMSQTEEGKDSHKNIKEEGVVTVNIRLIDYIKEQDLDTNIMFEFKPE